MVFGLIASLWYVLRVAPKPSRAAYPCQRAAAPLRWGFLTYLVALVGSVLAFRRAQGFLRHSKLVYATLFLILSGVSMTLFIQGHGQRLSAATNAPVGVAKGIFPGRVVWVHNPEAAKWTGSGNYWDPAVNPQGEYDRMVPAAILSLSGASSEREGWNKLFTWFNTQKGHGSHGYRAGEKIAIKINMNNSTTHEDHNISDANPAPIVALIRSLVSGAGVPQEMITVGDPSRAVTNNVYNAVHTAFPKVIVVDWLGTDGRTGPNWVENAIPEIAPLHTGIAACFIEARYIINLPLLKGHVGQGITFGAKSFFGATHINIDWKKSGGHPSTPTLQTFMTHKHLGAKVLLWCMDATYPNPDLDGMPPAAGWAEAPFNGRHCSSLFVSQDGPAEESVSLDFFYQHYASEVDGANNEGVAGILGSQKYIRETAQSGAGVFEHWNNSADRKYSRNLDPTAGTGIELVYVQVPPQQKSGSGHP